MNIQQMTSADFLADVAANTAPEPDRRGMVPRSWGWLHYSCLFPVGSTLDRDLESARQVARTRTASGSEVISNLSRKVVVK